MTTRIGARGKEDAGCRGSLREGTSATASTGDADSGPPGTDCCRPAVAVPFADTTGAEQMGRVCMRVHWCAWVSTSNMTREPDRRTPRSTIQSPSREHVRRGADPSQENDLAACVDAELERNPVDVPAELDRGDHAHAPDGGNHAQPRDWDLGRLPCSNVSLGHGAPEHEEVVVEKSWGGGAARLHNVSMAERSNRGGCPSISAPGSTASNAFGCATHLALKFPKAQCGARPSFQGRRRLRPGRAEEQAQRRV